MSRKNIPRKTKVSMIQSTTEKTVSTHLYTHTHARTHLCISTHRHTKLETNCLNVFTYYYDYYEYE